MALTDTYVGGSVSIGGVGSETVTGVPIGTASADRVVVQCIAPLNPPSAATIGGITANVYSPIAGLWVLSAAVPTGTTATIITTGTGGWTGIGTWALTGGADVVPTGSAADATGAGAISLAVQAGGCILGLGIDAASNASTPNWATGLTNQSSAYPDNPGTNTISIRDGGLDSATAQTVNATLNGCVFPYAIGVAFGLAAGDTLAPQQTFFM